MSNAGKYPRVIEINALHQKNEKNSGGSTAELPDISRLKKTDIQGQLSQVGMQNIEMPVLLPLGGQAPLLLPAQLNAYVSLDDDQAKGIHMSRLYLELKGILQNKPVSADTLKLILQRFLRTHEGLSETAYIEIRTRLPVERKALLSGEVGYRQYPVLFRASLNGGEFCYTLGAEILYSSTCPCSAALARQLLQEAFAEKFASSQVLSKSTVLEWLGKEESIVAVPHSQRSLARVLVKMAPHQDLSALELIDRLESAVTTPVQAAVKRVDEQEFARLNGQNLMFCEDAARRLRQVLEDPQFGDYYIHVEHQESLHPHEAVSRVVKGVAGGFVAQAMPAL